MRLRILLSLVLLLSIGVGSVLAVTDVTNGRPAVQYPVVPLPTGQRDFNVLWDLTHGVYLGYEPAQNYSELAAMLAANGFAVTTTTAGVDNIDLSPYDMLVINAADAYISAYGPSEVAAIVDFVNNRGGLLVMGDNTGVWPQNYNIVPQAFGTTCAVATDDSPTDFINHQIFNGVSTLSFLVSGVLSVGSPSIPAATNPGGQPLVSLVDPCKVVVVGDINVWDNGDLTLVDNQQFALNVFTCLVSGGPPVPVRTGTWGAIKSLYR